MPRDDATAFGDRVGQIEELRATCEKCGRACDASRRTAGLIGARADTDELNRGSTLEDDDVATLNTIRAVEDTVRAADDVIAAAEKVFGITRWAVSPVVVESPAQQATMAPDTGAVETSISVVKPSRPADESQPVDSSEFEGQICEIIRREVAPARKPHAEGDSGIGAGSINALLQRVAGSTFKEIDRLIDELQGLRDLALQAQHMSPSIAAKVVGAGSHLTTGMARKQT